MPTFRGFVAALQVRDDGWVEFSVRAVHAANQERTFFVADLDADLTKTHKKLAWVSLLRDALARTLPLEIEYVSDDRQGDLVEDITVYPRPSIDGRSGSHSVSGTVIWVGIAELGPLSGTSPYKDHADLAGVTLLTPAGGLEQFKLDLQRPDPLTAQAMLSLLTTAHRTRRPIKLLVGDWQRPDAPGLRADGGTSLAAMNRKGSAFTYVLGCEWVEVPETNLTHKYAFIERLEQRYESYEADAARALSHVGVVYTTAPAQTPEGDVSDNGTFMPLRERAWLHADSPLVRRLEVALREGLQVKLGLLEDDIQAVDLVSPLGSAARPIWITVRRSLEPSCEAPALCDNVPTTQGASAPQLGAIPMSVRWKGEGYFQRGIWRFVVRSPSTAKLTLDGQEVCCDSGEARGKKCCEPSTPNDAGRTALVCHAFTDGLHTVELEIQDRTCLDAFSFAVYRIR